MPDNNERPKTALERFSFWKQQGLPHRDASTFSKAGDPEKLMEALHQLMEVENNRSILSKVWTTMRNKLHGW